MYKLKYKIRDDGTYSATGVIGFTSTIKRLDIPAVHKGRSVTEVSGELLSKLTSLEELILPHCIKKIDIEELRNNKSLRRIEAAQDFSTEKSVDSVLPLFISIDGVLYSNYGKTLTKYPTKRPAEEFVIPDSVTSIGDRAFYCCRHLTGVTIGNGVTSIGAWAFSYCDSLTSVTIPDSVTSIGDRAFSYCDSLTSVTIPDSVTSIGNGAFLSCASLESVAIGNSVTSIGNYAFADCSSLTGVTIPDSVTSIGEWAFSGCSSLTSVYYTGTATEWGEVSISLNNSDLTSATRYYYSESEPTESGNYWHYVDGVPTKW